MPRKHSTPPAGWASAAIMLLALPLGLHAATTQDLNVQAQQRAQAELKRCGDKYAAHVDTDGHVIYVSALDDDSLSRTRQMLSEHTAAYRKMLPCSQPPWNVVVVLITADDYQKLMPPLKVAPEVKVAGVYEGTTHRVTATDRGQVLRHEFTHALHHADACAARQSHPIWLREGLAMLFQDARVSPSGLEPALGGELWTLQKALREKRTIPFERFFRMGPKTFYQTSELSYAQSTYVLFYLYHLQRLSQWYRQFKAEFAADPSGQKVFEALLGNRTETLEGQWKEWVAGLEYEGNPRRMSQGRLGLTIANHPKGAKITGLLDGGAARAAGRLQVGDVILKFNGIPTRNATELSAAIRASGAMQTVAVDLLRDGRAETVYQPLGAPKNGE